MAVWQKSTYSGDASNCLNIGAAADGSLRLRESDYPGTVLVIPPGALRALIGAAKAGLFRAGGWWR
ncbi:DUF397 domain-containing protein [Streptomyces cinnamoneus]|uniref:DUF397 domain-containing protein n=1 Tax=Streptomyces cinnamoneus TaxID=53446 RepID=UPI00340216EA